MSRTHKKKYTKSKAISKNCRNHGSCPYCKGNRMYKHLKKMDKIKQRITLDDYYKGFES